MNAPNRAKLIFIRCAIIITLIINSIYLNLGLTEKVFLERFIVIPMTFLIFLSLIIYWNNLYRLTMSSTSFYLLHLFTVIFLIRPEGITFYPYLLIIPLMLGIIDGFKGRFSRILSMSSLTMFIASIVADTILQINAGSDPIAAVVSHINLLVVGVVMIILFIMNISLNIRSLNIAKRESLIDPLTSTFNRRALQADLAGILTDARGEVPVMVMMDIDDFKKVNDRFGHPAGDVVLTGIADITKCSVRSSDRLYRYGGEEFLLILKSVASPTAENLAEKIRENIERHSWTSLNNQTVTCSFGVCEIDRHLNIETNLNNVDKALYRAKAEGKNRVWIQPKEIYAS